MVARNELTITQSQFRSAYLVCAGIKIFLFEIIPNPTSMTPPEPLVSHNMIRLSLAMIIP